jgi:hypothetical protein
MHAVPLASPARPTAPPAWAWIAFGGLALGLGDLAFAALYWFLQVGLPPIRVAQAIAGWVLGSEAARAGGLATAFAGAALYCYIVGAMVAGYLRLHARSLRVRNAGLAAGVVYGLAMYALLFKIVLPLFAANAGGAALPWHWTLACLAAYAGIGAGCAAIAATHARTVE